MSASDVIADTSEADQATVRRRLDEILDAVTEKDFDRLAGYHLDSPKFTKFDDFEPLDRQDIRTTNHLEAKGLGGIEGFRGEFRDLKIDIFGPVGIATAIFDYGFDSDDGSVALRARATLVLVDNNGDWQIAHEHFSPFKANP